MRLPTKYIFLDTNIFEGNNYFHGRDIQSILYYSNIGFINLCMTTISKMELINRMKKSLIEVKEDHNKLVNFINKTRILKNLNSYEKFEKSKLKIDTSIKELSSKLENIIISSKINIINSDNVNIEEIFELYYNQEPPFSSNGKKYEFTDAFIIKSIDSWCKFNGKKMIFVTNDFDFWNYKSSNIILKNDLSKLLSDISISYDSRQKVQIIPFIEKNLKLNKVDLIELIDSEIDPFISLDLDFEKISDYKREKIKFIDYKISSIRSDYAEINYNIELEISFTVFPTKFEIYNSFFEDGLKPQKIRLKKIVSCDIEVGLKKNNDINLKWINSNQKILIQTN